METAEVLHGATLLLGERLTHLDRHLAQITSALGGIERHLNVISETLRDPERGA